MFFGFISIYTLDTVSHNDTSYNSKIERAIERHVFKHDIALAFCRQIRLTCKGLPQDEQPSENATTEDELAYEMDHFSLTNPAIDQDLAKAGILIQTDAAGNPIGATGPNGPITAGDIINNTNGIADSIEEALPATKVGQAVDYTSTMYDEAGASFDIMDPSNPTDNVQEDVDSAIEKGAQGQGAAQEAASEQQDQQPTQQSTPEEASAYKTADASSSALVNAENALESDLNKGMSVTAAEEDVAGKSFGLSTGGTVAVTTGVIDVCLLQKVMTIAAAARLPLIMTLLIRNGTTMQSIASQINSGHLTGAEYNKATSLYTNDRGTFSQSAAWQRVTGKQVVSSTPDLAQPSMPTAIAATQIISSIGSFLQGIPGESQVCSVAGSPWFTVVSIGGLVLQFIGDGASFGTSQVAITGGLVALQYSLIHYAIPKALSYLMPVNLLGQQNAIQRFNAADAGLNLGYGNYARSWGGVPMNNSTASTEYAAANNHTLAEIRRTPFIDRMFALSDPNSLVSRVAVSLPIGFTNLFSTIFGLIIHSPSYFLASLASIGLASDAHAAQANLPGEAYGITQYGFTRSQASQYPQIANENYLHSNVCYDSKCASRISMLGDPVGFINTPNGDPNNNDMLHCFVDSYSLIMATTSSTGAIQNFAPGVPANQDAGADHNCGVVGIYDYQSGNINTTNLSTSSSTPSEMPNDYTAASIYCQYLTGSSDSSCISGLLSSGQISNEIGHYRQYLLDLHVMNDLYTLGTKS